MSIRSLQNISFQNPNLWEFSIFSDLENNESLKYLVTDTTLPLKKFETETSTTGSKHYTKFVPEGEFSITFRETIRWDVYNFLKGWMDSVYNNETKTFISGNKKYKTGLLFFERTLTPFNTVINKSFTMYHMQIKGISDISVNYENSGLLPITATFEADELRDNNIAQGFKDSSIETTLTQNVTQGFEGFSQAKNILNI